MIVIEDAAGYISKQDFTMLEVMNRINQLPHLFQIITDENGRVVGTVTDGDLRRALLHGKKFDAPIAECMHLNPMVGLLSQPEAHVDLLKRVYFLPVVDDDGQLKEIVVRARNQVSSLSTALVMAGGLGSRLGEITQTTPKPLLPVGDKPILERILTGLENADITEVFISVHHLADQIEEFIAARDNRAHVELVHEPTRLGTAGTISYLKDRVSGPFLVSNGDVITRVDYGAVSAFHDQHGYDATIAVTSYDVQIPFGVINYDENGLFSKIDEKPTSRHYVAGGLYILSPQFTELVPQGQPVDMPDLLNLGKDNGAKIGLFPIHEYWMDVGRPADLAAASQDHS